MQIGQATAGNPVQQFEIDKILDPELQSALTFAASGADCPDFIPEAETVEEFLNRDLEQTDPLWSYQHRVRYLLPQAAEVLEALQRLGYEVVDNILQCRLCDLLRLLARAWIENKHQLC